MKKNHHNPDPGRPQVGLVLGSGSARGWAHIGVIQALEEAQVPIDMVVGTSIGAFVGAVYATGELESLREFALRMNWKMVLSYFDVVFPRSGFLDGRKVHELFSMHTKAQTFEDFRIPVRIVATDLNTGRMVVLDSGSIIEAIRASVAVPGVITPVVTPEHLLVDGGLVNPVPVDIAREQGAEVVIAVDLNSGLIARRRRKASRPPDPDPRVEEPPRNELVARLYDRYIHAERRIKEKITQWTNTRSALPNIMEIIGTSFGILEEQITRSHLERHPPDILIQPRLGDLKMFDFDQAERSIREGYQRTREQLPALKALLETGRTAV